MFILNSKCVWVRWLRVKTHIFYYSLGDIVLSFHIELTIKIYVRCNVNSESRRKLWENRMSNYGILEPI